VLRPCPHDRGILSVFSLLNPGPEPALIIPHPLAAILHVVVCSLKFSMLTTSPSSELFRRVMGSFPTGITVLTVEREPGQVHGMTANSFTSVSLDPLLILVCIDEDARLLSYLKTQRRFGVSILKDSQQQLSEYFTLPKQDPAEEVRLGIRFRWTPSGIPLLEDALGHLACNVVAQYMAGDHTIFVAEVESLELKEGQPLLYHRGRYRTLLPSSI
jgi:flavin reductase (DIM6/NTAB) family NADH-FMN oxidoreductase RutF